MKLRLLGNSIRLRIQQKELTELDKTGVIKEEISFGPASEHKFIFSLEASGNSSQLDASFDKGCISVIIPHNFVRELVQTDLVGVSHKKTLIGGDLLSILVEKDFKCLTPREEDADAFPHPSIDHGSC